MAWHENNGKQTLHSYNEVLPDNCHKCAQCTQKQTVLIILPECQTLAKQNKTKKRRTDVSWARTKIFSLVSPLSLSLLQLCEEETPGFGAFCLERFPEPEGGVEASTGAFKGASDNLIVYWLLESKRSMLMKTNLKSNKSLYLKYFMQDR